MALERYPQGSALLRMLADRRWHSGPELAAASGISRAAVAKRVASARQHLGADIVALRGRGYRLAHGFTPLAEDAIRAHLSPDGAAGLAELSVAGSVASTSDYLLAEQTCLGRQHCRALFAEHQYCGRGRRGRHWISPFGANLYFSVGRSFDPAPKQIGALGLAIGVVLAETITSLGIPDVGVKWPNDLVARGAKLGGILIEHRGQVAAGCRVVVGVGLNINMTPAAAPTLEQPWTTLTRLVAVPPDRNHLAAAALAAVITAMQDYARDGFELFHRRWRRFDAVAGRDVVLTLGSEQVSGRAQGIAADGALMVTVEGQRRRFYTGDVSLRVC